MNDNYFYIVLVGCVIVTFLPRILPFLIAKYIIFPEWMTTFLRYLPLTMMTTLMFQNIFVRNENTYLVTIDFVSLMALVPGLMIGYFRRSLMLVVLSSVVVMAVIRYFNI
ncbi:branched-chain amino acid ABC transporter [Leuconostoc litchii]|uniref:AzlD domain-containing protein n=1 Tax=Leuconostoc litchii TaxID=1981069 RepID=A0A6P2CMK7_9LACO|nr:AzlD domain-containing protein [Leuconostoc litchii]TYC47116.1 AzlD domain-containing protein [Leuconostoc litchii]GMA69069.1 branched-chain amino acid ABC transporter [Leuconostoc litchii]